MGGKHLRPHNADKLHTAEGYRPRCGCGRSKCWTYSTNGDGSSVQVCTACGTPYPIGRYYQDTSAGFRLVAFSIVSALKTFPPAHDDSVDPAA